MNNSAVKIVLSLIFAVVSTVASASAQVSQKTFDAQISFDFIVGKKMYPAGAYRVRVVNLHSIPILSFENTATHDWKQMHVRTNGSRSKTERTVLIFDRYGDKFVLTQMISPDFGLSAPLVKANKNLVRKFGKPDHTIAVVLKNVGKNAD